MKRCLLNSMACLAFGILGVADLRADDAAEPPCPFSFETSVGLFTDYMFRGQNLYNGTSIQPDFKVNYDAGDYGAIWGSFWMQVPGENGNVGLNNFVETDYTLNYEYVIDMVMLSAGNIWYRYPHDSAKENPQTHEVYVSASLDTFLAPTLTVYHDYGAYDAQYYEFNISHEIKAEALGEASITPFATAGFASNADEIYEKSGLETINVGAQLDLAVGPVSVVPVINYNFKIDDYTVNELWAGVTLSYSM